MENSKVVRVFTGLGAANSGRTIYDAAIANTAIDQQQARFDPRLTAEKSHTRDETPNFGEDLASPFGIGAVGLRGDTDRSAVGVEKVNPFGGLARLGLRQRHAAIAPDWRQREPGRSVGTGNEPDPAIAARRRLSSSNMAPIVLARLDTERSYFQFKDATQELVRGTIEAYWNLVLARLQLWAVEIQYKQADEAFKLRRSPAEGRD